MRRDQSRGRSTSAPLITAGLCWRRLRGAWLEIVNLGASFFFQTGLAVAVAWSYVLTLKINFISWKPSDLCRILGKLFVFFMYKVIVNVFGWTVSDWFSYHIYHFKKDKLKVKKNNFLPFSTVRKNECIKFILQFNYKKDKTQKYLGWL